MKKEYIIIIIIIIIKQNFQVLIQACKLLSLPVSHYTSSVQQLYVIKYLFPTNCTYIG
jgi:hypothetical protein